MPFCATPFCSTAAIFELFDVMNTLPGCYVTPGWRRFLLNFGVPLDKDFVNSSFNDNFSYKLSQSVNDKLQSYWAYNSKHCELKSVKKKGSFVTAQEQH